MPASLAPGQWVRLTAAPDWGLGQVQSVTGVRVTVNFEHAGKRVRLDFGQTLLLPAGLGHCQISPRGSATVLTCIVP